MIFNQGHRITLTSNTDSLVVYPAMDSIVYTFEKNDDLGAVRKVIEDAMIFINQNGSNAYDWLKAIENQCDVCSSVSITIEKWCDSAWLTVYDGWVKLRDGEWREEDKSYCELAIEPNDPFSSIGS